MLKPPGRWMMAEFVKVAKTSDIAPGEAKAVDLGVRCIALFNIDGPYHAIDDTCTHQLTWAARRVCGNRKR
jgi:nitrite reductase/ring-hydroxylating ferredoxin subunit